MASANRLSNAHLKQPLFSFGFVTDVQYADIPDGRSFIGIPLDPGATAPESLLWNYEEVMEVIHRYKCVKVCFAGHDHTGGHSIDSPGIHHCVLEAALECPPGSDAFGYVDVYHDRLLLSGADRMRSAEMVFIS